MCEFGNPAPLDCPLPQLPGYQGSFSSATQAELENRGAENTRAAE